MTALRLAVLRIAAWLSRLALRMGSDTGSSMSIESAAKHMIADGARPVDGALEPAPPGYVAMTPRGQLLASLGTAVILANDDAGVFVPIFVGPAEALALRARLEGTTPPRPLAYDLIDRLLELTDATLQSVRIEELRGNVFVARIEITVAGTTTSIDARASDSIILATGRGMSVWVADAVVESAGRVLDMDWQLAYRDGNA